jgi:hypothetical protein
MVPQGYIREFRGFDCLKKQLPKTISKYKIIPIYGASSGCNGIHLEGSTRPSEQERSMSCFQNIIDHKEYHLLGYNAV